jgi:transposase-like protein
VKGGVTLVFHLSTRNVAVWILANKFCNWHGQPSPVNIMMHQKQLEHAEYFEYLNSMISNDARSMRKINSKISKAKAAFSKKKALFTSKLD